MTVQPADHGRTDAFGAHHDRPHTTHGPMTPLHHHTASHSKR